ncbi:MAG: 2,3-epoxybenzoyl-CoA dihydrolase [Carbonactinosporaceae bacterium]
MTATTDSQPAHARAPDPPEGQAEPRVSFQTAPDTYRHWRLDVDGEIATLTLDVDERATLAPGYELKLNSYDLGVDIELHDAVQRLRFEHPEVRAVVVTSGRGGRDRVFCAGANIRMLAQASHPLKVNFCKFTNETRCAIEDATADSGQTYIAAVNGTASGGGYELALACDEIVLVDDGSSAVSAPEIPLLAVLPGTGGLTRVVDKRRVRKDLADVFATRAEGVRGATAVEWRLADAAVPRRDFDGEVRRRAEAAAARSARPKGAPGIALTPLHREETADAIRYRHVAADLDRDEGRVTITVHGPADDPPTGVTGIHEQGADLWPLAVARELDDLILSLRVNELELGTWVLKTAGDPAKVLAHDALLAAHARDWFVDEVRLLLKRTYKRLDNTSRSLIALVEPGSCFAGSLLELALAADRSYMLEGSFDDNGGNEPAQRPAAVTLGELNFGALPMANGLSRLASRFLGDGAHLESLREQAGEPLEAAEAAQLGLVTFAFDDIDWEDEVRLALEERASFSPDALTGMEANHRFAGPETLETKIYARLTAWQNWIFNRPNASGPDGALRRFGTGQRATFDRKRA